MKKTGIIKVDKSIKPIHYKERTKVELVVGCDYYVSFGNSEAKRCKLIEICDEGGRNQIKVEISTKYQTAIHTLFTDEIGTTPEEAVINEVTL
ncbi:hypothetical protein M2459_002472 [Parabacteroides sp. PF5-5]|uniref:hypothetical protein n=1 Tax=unclassified Parabacteroides TaxID=2649774 RepID=UPI002475AB26|nr:MULTISPECIES: hypothetical protein [unclassified Parabacteroides]MDH6305772.1 hypothetical protein [Parabacteroides sp. PH5-39]MDH6316844.1 hypothetical protein [Parabacteroides sp. PF5-13]MDH6320485.1 hypothetical protein [Parabacteroides sp. PH5-13]MDH6324215.1 hypothetical protein [Parabacteroides sp. PH5-8]MDH6328030.1 hypothetical protein [Parabacteroides sp. PH5-41]